MSLPRVNVFTDLFDDGLKSGTHCFDVDVNNVGDDAPLVLAKLRLNSGLAEEAAEQGARPFTVFASLHSQSLIRCSKMSRMQLEVVEKKRKEKKRNKIK